MRKFSCKSAGCARRALTVIPALASADASCGCIDVLACEYPTFYLHIFIRYKVNIPSTVHSFYHARGASHPPRTPRAIYFINREPHIPFTPRSACCTYRKRRIPQTQLCTPCFHGRCISLAVYFTNRTFHRQHVSPAEDFPIMRRLPLFGPSQKYIRLFQPYFSNAFHPAQPLSTPRHSPCANVPLQESPPAC